jgi:lipopolysaccharide/colanic/teichoic acid biosynthesis glycosyltransferase
MATVCPFPTPSRSTTRPSRTGRGRRPVLDETLFRSSLTRQQYRAERISQPFGLVLVAADAPDDRRSWDALIGWLAGSTRGTDILGWVERDRLIGVIMPSISDCGRRAGRFEERFAFRVPPDLRCAIEVHVVDGAARAADPRGSASPIPILGTRHRRATTYDAVKRAVDIAGSLTLLVLLAPLLAVIAAAVKANSRGPILFRQTRVGQMMQPFTFLKFRTMTVDADPALHREYVTRFIRGAVPSPPSDTPALFKLADDPRVTRVGRVLRKTSLDELPQLWNVLRGDMSLVGPRPPIQYEVETYQPWHRRRILEAKPGLTGPWQVAGRSRTTFDEMVRLDLRYARTRSLWNDVKILAATPAAVIAGRGAC